MKDRSKLRGEAAAAARRDEDGNAKAYPRPRYRRSTATLPRVYIRICFLRIARVRYLSIRSSVRAGLIPCNNRLGK